MTEEDKVKIMREAFDAHNIRVYEYVDDEGRVFWSFVETQRRVDMYRLRLVDRVGLQFVRWVFELRNLIRKKIQIQDDNLEDEQLVREFNWGTSNKLKKK